MRSAGIAPVAIPAEPASSSAPSTQTSPMLASGPTAPALSTSRTRWPRSSRALPVPGRSSVLFDVSDDDRPFACHRHPPAAHSSAPAYGDADAPNGVPVRSMSGSVPGDGGAPYDT